MTQCDQIFNLQLQSLEGERMIDFDCFCGRGVSAPDGSAGRKALCSACGTELVIPVPSDKISPTAHLESPRPTPAVSPAPTPRAPLKLFGGWRLAGFSGLIVVAIGVMGRIVINQPRPALSNPRTTPVTPANDSAILRRLASLEQEVAALRHLVMVIKAQERRLSPEESARLKAVSPSEGSVVMPFTDSGVIESRIDGDFAGWDGETIFRLENGQVWQQDAYSYNYHFAFRPRVTVCRLGDGWTMQVEGCARSLRVKRLR